MQIELSSFSSLWYSRILSVVTFFSIVTKNPYFTIEVESTNIAIFLQSMTFSKGNSILLSLTITGTHMLTTTSKSQHDAVVELAGSKQNFDECIPCEAKPLISLWWYSIFHYEIFFIFKYLKKQLMDFSYLQIQNSWLIQLFLTFSLLHPPPSFVHFINLI